MVPTWRVLGALGLSGVLAAYGTTSEVSWLFLLSDWMFVLVVVAVAYSLWTGYGLRLFLAAGKSVPAGDSPVHWLPDHLLRAGPYPAPVFEGDSLRLEVGLDNAGAARGPAWIAGMVAGQSLEAGTGLVPRKGWRTEKSLAQMRRGVLGATGWSIRTSDPMGFFRDRRQCPEGEVAVVLPRFASLAGRMQTREQEASIASPRAGAGSELFGVREYHAGDSLRRIHWRSSARHGELVVREYEPPGVRSLAIYLDPGPRNPEVADQVARIAASEAWDCIREGGHVTLWAPGLEPAQARGLWVALEWLARYPGLAGDEPAPAGTEAVIVTGAADPRLIDALETARRRGSRVRAWVVGDADLDVDAPVEHVGIEWPL